MFIYNLGVSWSLDFSSLTSLTRVPIPWPSQTFTLSPILKVLVNRRILDKANAFGGSSQDDAARFESGALGEKGDGLTDVEYLIAEKQGG